MLEGFHDSDSIFKSYLDAVLPGSEAPASYHALVVMAILGALVGRRGALQFGPHVIYPMSPTILIGPSGIGKSEAMGIGKRLLKHINPNVFVVQDEATPEAVVLAFLHRVLGADEAAIEGKSLVQRGPGERQEVALIAGEMATMFKKSGSSAENMLPVVTRLLEQDDDYARTLVKDITKGKMQLLDRPTLTFMAGTTVEWMRELMPSQLFSGGFIRRCLITREKKKRVSIPIPRNMGDDVFLALALEWRKRLSKFYSVEVEQRGVAFDWSDSEKWWVSWKMEHDKKMPEDSRMAGHHNSMPYVVMRTAMVFAASKNSTKITPKEFNDATHFISNLRAQAMSVLMESAVHGFEEGTQQLERLLMENPLGVTNRQLMKSIRMPPKQLGELVEWAIGAGMMTQTGNSSSQGPIYKRLKGSS